MLLGTNNGLEALYKPRPSLEDKILLPSGPGPMALVDGEGRKLAGNDLFEAMAPAVFVQRGGYLGLRNPCANQRFAAGLAAVTAREQLQIGVPAARGAKPVVIRITRAGPTCERRLLMVMDLSQRASPTVHLLQELFGLTHSEAEVAQGIGEARSLQALARAQGLSLQTVRSQLRAVFAKTGVRRQVELAVLIARLVG